MLRTGPIGHLAAPAAALASAILLWLAYPPVGNADAAFFALAPLLLALRSASPRAGFRLGYVFGLVFRLLSLSWMFALHENGGPVALVVLGHLALSAYCALYTGLFGFAVSCAWSFARRDGLPAAWAFRAGAWIAEPLLWVGAEHLVGFMLTGFPWNPLAATQYRNLALLSCVSLAGAATLSALLVAVNGGLASLLARIWHDALAPRFRALRAAQTGERAVPPAVRPSRGPRTIPLGCALIALVAVWMHGMDAVRAADRAFARAPQFRLALVHPDSPCIFERDDEALAAANEAILSYTELAGATGPDLVIWPETTLPGLIPYDRESASMIRTAYHHTGAPLLAGGVEYVPRYKGDSDGPLYNTAFLFGEGPSIAAFYRKRHLVPFGEYIPLESRIPFLKRLAPTGFSCEAGDGPVCFEVTSHAVGTNAVTALFAPLICFEDAFPYLARDAARAGAAVLVAIANDAWFDGTCEAEQHLAQAVLRAVETGLPVIRSANRGVTAFILPNGRVLRRLGDGRGSGTPGFLSHDFGIDPSPRLTPYSRHGDAFLATPCAGFLVGLAAAAALIGRRRRRQRTARGAVPSGEPPTFRPTDNVEQ